MEIKLVQTDGLIYSGPIISIADFVASFIACDNDGVPLNVPMLIESDVVALYTMGEIRSMRDKLLLESDWTQLPNNPLSVEKQNEWAAYRQALRDITETYQVGQELTWPTKPQ